MRRRLVLALLTTVVAAPAIQAQDLSAAVYASGFSLPVAIVQDPTNPAVQFVVQKGGLVRTVVSGTVLPTAFLNLTTQVSTNSERGLLGLAFSPDYATSGRLYVNFTNLAGHTVIARFNRSTSDPLVVNPSTRFDLRWNGPSSPAYIEQPEANHNGGDLAFGGDGYLYIGLGDGGGGNDPGNFAQTPTSLLGKMLRVDVNVADSDPIGYRIPAGNPFVTGARAEARDEIWAFGLRNPWRFSFDRAALGGSGAMIIGDVGQGAWEEIDYEPAGRGGRNYGWRYREGAHDGTTTTPPYYTPLTDPLYEYDRNVGASITGGVVYRGSRLVPGYRGRYFFADFVRGRIWSLGLTIGPDGDARANGILEHTAALSNAGAPGNISAFGLDAAGEIFVVSYSRGVILRILNPLPATPSGLRIVRP